MRQYIYGREESLIKKLEIDYTLADDKQEKIAIKLSLLNLGHRIKENKKD